MVGRWISVYGHCVCVCVNVSDADVELRDVMAFSRRYKKYVIIGDEARLVPRRCSACGWLLFALDTRHHRFF
jgi:hypothetical protein